MSKYIHTYRSRSTHLYLYLYVQAWWRGIMVRCTLGQFRKNKVLRTKLMKIQKDRAKNAAKANK